jgi:hypothetical protein
MKYSRSQTRARETVEALPSEEVEVKQVSADDSTMLSRDT